MTKDHVISECIVKKNNTKVPVCKLYNRIRPYMQKARATGDGWKCCEPIGLCGRGIGTRSERYKMLGLVPL